uniref:Uncharacterized protein n=1 Tax=Tetranychus urticae TaxID=32264 RepID=T1KQ45_TETUR
MMRIVQFVNEASCIRALMYAKYRNNRDNYLPIHGHHLNAWALESAKTLGLGPPEFQDSSKFMKSFKDVYRITSRKITTKRTSAKVAEIRNPLLISLQKLTR